MKFPGVFVLCLLLLSAPVHGAEESDDPKAGTLVDCGTKKVAIFADTSSPDGHYALGWTVRPNDGNAPVDWFGYDPKDPTEWAKAYGLDDPYQRGTKYTLLNGVLDLHARKFTPFVCDDPYLPQENHQSIGVTWSGELRGARYAIVNEDSRYQTEFFWLVRIDAGGTHVAALSKTIRWAIVTFLQTHHARGYRDYEIIFSPIHDAKTGEPPPAPFLGRSLKIYFSAGNHMSADAPFYEGSLILTLPGGNITHLTGQKDE